MEGMNEFITMNYLATYAGTVFTVNLMVQFTKELIDKYIAKIHTRWVVFLYAEIVMFGVAYFQKALDAENVFLLVLNGVLVAMTAMGSYALTAERRKEG